MALKAIFARRNNVIFMTEKQKYYPTAVQTEQQQSLPGNSSSETPQEFAAGKQAANSQAAGYNIFAKPAVQPQPAVQLQVVAQQRPVQVAQQQSTPVKPYTGGANNPQGALDYLTSLYTSPEEEDRMRKSSLANQRIMAVADALRHIGNIYNTVKGAPAQQLSNPAQEEYARYQQAKAVRDAANHKYYTYQQQKAAQDLRAQQLNESTDLKLRQLAFNQDKFNRQQNLNEFKAKNDKWYKEATIKQKEEYLDIQRALSEGRISLMEAQARITNIKADAGGFAPKTGRSGRAGGSNMPNYDVVTTYERDNEGRATKVTKTRTVKGANGQATTTTKQQVKGFGGNGSKGDSGSNKKRIKGFGSK